MSVDEPLQPKKVEKKGMKVPVKKSDGSTVMVPYDEFRSAYNLKKSPKKDGPVTNAPVEEVEGEAPKPRTFNDVLAGYTDDADDAPAEVSVPSVQESPKPTAAQTPVQKEESSQPKPAPEKKSGIKPPPKLVPRKKKQEKKVASPAPTPAAEPEPAAPARVPRKTNTGASMALSNATPVRDFFVDEAAAASHDWDDDDHRSPLEEDLASEPHGTHGDLPAIPSARDDILKQVLGKLSFSLGDDLHSRLKTLIQSRLKEVRKNEQVLDYAQKGKQQGGLGLPENQATELLNAILDVLHLSHEQPAPKPLPHLSPNVKGPSVDAPPKPTAVPLADPFPPVSKAPAATGRALPSTTKPMMQDVVPPKKKESTPFEKMQQAAPAPKEEKPMMHTPETISPIDEIRMLDLTELHRFGDTPEEREAEVVERFDILKGESYFQYLDGIKAWYQSPLYTMYREMLAEAINQGRSLAEIGGQHGQGDMLIADFMTVAKINRHIM